MIDATTVRPACAPHGGSPLRSVRGVTFVVAFMLFVLGHGNASASHDGEITSYVPVGTDLAVVAWTGGPTDLFVDLVAERHCTARTIWALAGDSRSYVVGAPPFVNSAWIAAHGGDVAPADLHLLVVCDPRRLRGSVFDDAQVLALYGYPGIPVMGILGSDTPERIADEAFRLAADYEALGDRRVIPAFQPIALVAQRFPGAAGDYAYRMPRDVLMSYIEVARERGMLVILDLQMGWADPLEEVRRLEDVLIEPFVHLAVDPEYMTRDRGRAPGTVIGGISGHTIDAIQTYLADLIHVHRLPPKMLVVHQFLDDMVLVPTPGLASHANVEVVIDMDGFGPPLGKLSKYQRYSLGPHAERAGLKLFFDWDVPLLTPSEVQGLTPPPDLIIYQ